MKTSKTRASELRRLGTEQPNPTARNLDTKSALEIARVINREDAKVSASVRKALPQIARAIESIAEHLSHGGRLIYVGTGTSGRIGALDAIECAPTFNLDPRTVQFVIAGGNQALAAAVESNEDSSQAGRREMKKRNPGRSDVVVGISASGRTPFTVAALRYARSRGAATVAVVCNPESALGAIAHLAIVTDVGPEVVAGSSRMKAGTAQKMVLNMLSTGAMARLGYVLDNLMVNVHLNNEKLAHRGLDIVVRATGAAPGLARQVLRQAGAVPVAIVMIAAGVGKAAATSALALSHGNVRSAINKAAGK